MMEKAMRKVAKEEVGKHVKAMHGKAFKKGGPTTDDRMKYGKNLSRAMNQKTG
jgi:hypothetical protein